MTWRISICFISAVAALQSAQKLSEYDSASGIPPLPVPSAPPALDGELDAALGASAGGAQPVVPPGNLYPSLNEPSPMGIPVVQAQALGPAYGAPIQPPIALAYNPAEPPVAQPYNFHAMESPAQAAAALQRRPQSQQQRGSSSWFPRCCTGPGADERPLNQDGGGGFEMSAEELLAGPPPGLPAIEPGVPSSSLVRIAEDAFDQRQIVDRILIVGGSGPGRDSGPQGLGHVWINHRSDMQEPNAFGTSVLSKHRGVYRQEVHMAWWPSGAEQEDVTFLENSASATSKPVAKFGGSNRYQAWLGQYSQIPLNEVETIFVVFDPSVPESFQYCEIFRRDIKDNFLRGDALQVRPDVKIVLVAWSRENVRNDKDKYDYLYFHKFSHTVPNFFDTDQTYKHRLSEEDLHDARSLWSFEKNVNLAFSAYARRMGYNGFQLLSYEEYVPTHKYDIDEHGAEHFAGSLIQTGQTTFSGELSPETVVSKQDFVDADFEDDKATSLVQVESGRGGGGRGRGGGMSSSGRGGSSTGRGGGVRVSRAAVSAPSGSSGGFDSTVRRGAVSAPSSAGPNTLYRAPPPRHEGQMGNAFAMQQPPTAMIGSTGYPVLGGGRPAVHPAVRYRYNHGNYGAYGRNAGTRLAMAFDDDGYDYRPQPRIVRTEHRLAHDPQEDRSDVITLFQEYFPSRNPIIPALDLGRVRQGLPLGSLDTVSIPIVVAGPTGVGKTSLIRDFIHGRQGANQQPTNKVGWEMGPRFALDLDLGKHPQFPILELAGSLYSSYGAWSGWDNEVSDVLDAVIPKAYAIVLVFDITNPASLKELLWWKSKIEGMIVRIDVPIFLVANKVDQIHYTQMTAMRNQFHRQFTWADLRDIDLGIEQIQAVAWARANQGGDSAQVARRMFKSYAQTNKYDDVFGTSAHTPGSGLNEAVFCHINQRALEYYKTNPQCPDSGGCVIA